MARARRPRREAPALELLARTLPELRRGLTESAARTLAYELFEKLGFGAVAVTDRERVLAFADYVRSKLARPNELVTLDDELRHVQSYLDLEQARFGSQLEVTIDVPADARAVRVPPFLVQPLVENAVKHGKADRPLRVV